MAYEPQPGDHVAWDTAHAYYEGIVQSNDGVVAQIKVVECSRKHDYAMGCAHWPSLTLMRKADYEA